MHRLVCVLIFFVVPIASCRSETVGAELSEVRSSWHTGCLEALSKEVDRETQNLELNLPALPSMHWKVTIVLEQGKANVELSPVSSPSIRGGGGKYKFDCQNGILELVEPYR
jgi:hypothetical protein